MIGVRMAQDDVVDRRQGRRDLPDERQHPIVVADRLVVVRARVVDEREVWCADQHAQASPDVHHIHRERRSDCRCWRVSRENSRPPLRDEPLDPVAERVQVVR